MYEELSASFLGSFIVDVYLIDWSPHNWIINKNFCEKLKELFYHRTRCYIQDDWIKATVTTAEFQHIISYYFNVYHSEYNEISKHGQKLVIAIKQQVSLRTSQGVCQNLEIKSHI